MESKLEGIKRILNTYGMTKSDLSEIVLKGSKFNDVAQDLVKLFAIPVVSNRRELLIAYNNHILDKLSEYEGDEICDNMVDDFLGNL